MLLNSQVLRLLKTTYNISPEQAYAIMPEQLVIYLQDLVDRLVTESEHIQAQHDNKNILAVDLHNMDNREITEYFEKQMRRMITNNTSINDLKQTYTKEVLLAMPTRARSACCSVLVRYCFYQQQPPDKFWLAWIHGE